MAKQNGKTETALAPIEVGELAPFDPNALSSARPDFIPDSNVGTDDFGKDDIRMARLGIAQSTSNQIIPDDPLFIDGLKIYEMFNDQTKHVYGRGPVYFIVVDHATKWIEFGPDRKGVLDMDVAAVDPRTKWRTDSTGKRLPPAATKYSEFVSMIVMNDGPSEEVVISIKNTNKLNTRAVTDLIGSIRKYGSLRPRVPINGVIYSLETVPAKNDKGTFAVPVVKARGFVPKAEWFERTEAFRQSLVGKNVVVDREPGDESETEEDM